MYNNVSAAGVSITAPVAASTMPFDFPLGPQTEPLWMVLGGFAIFAALQAVKRIAPTWTDLVGELPLEEHRTSEPLTAAR